MIPMNAINIFDNFFSQLNFYYTNNQIYIKYFGKLFYIKLSLKYYYIYTAGYFYIETSN